MLPDTHQRESIALLKDSINAVEMNKQGMIAQPAAGNFFTTCPGFELGALLDLLQAIELLLLALQWNEIYWNEFAYGNNLQKPSLL